MNKLFFLFSLVFLFSVSSFSQKLEGVFLINGNVSGFKDSTLIYLDDFTTPQTIHIDSTLIIGNQFSFKGSLKEKVKRVMVGTNNFNNSKYFWLENSVISFTAEKGKFRQAVITGSKSQVLQEQLFSTYSNNREKNRDINLAFIKTHPNSIVSANVLNGLAPTIGKDTTQLLYNELSAEIKKTFYGKAILEFITLNKNPKVGDRYIDFKETNVDGKKISFSNFNGKVVLLDFWGSWCIHCRKENPELIKIYQEYKNKGFEILGVGAETNKQIWLDAIKHDKLTWENVTDFKGENNIASIIYGVHEYPTNFLIDKNGIIVAKNLYGDKLKNKLKELLK